MGSLFKRVLALVPPLMLVGCLQSETVVTVDCEGSGTIDETVLVRRDLVEKIRGFVAALGGEPEVTAVSARTLRERARRLGEGVSFVGAEELVEGEFAGYRARYAFSDVTRIRVGPSGGKPFFAGPLEGVTGGAGEVRFGFTGGTPASLVVRRDLPPPNLAGASPVPMISTGTEADGGTLFRGMKVTLAVVVAGRVTETTATYREGNRVTLVDLDVDRLASLPEGFDPREGEAPTGLRAEPQGEIYVKFR